MGSKNDKYYMEKALVEIDAIIKYSKNMPYDEFMQNEQTIDSVLFRLIQLIENIKDISNAYKLKHNEIPWGDIIGFRNGIVHEYGQTNYTTVYEIISRDIYQLKELFESDL